MNKACFFLLVLAAACLVYGASPLLAQARSDCEATRSAAEKKVEEEKRKEDERQQNNYPDSSDLESGLESCLGAIDVLGGGGGGSLNLPSVDDIINGLCKQAREAITKQAGGGLNFVSDVNRGNNWVRPWDPGWNESIWNALQ